MSPCKEGGHDPHHLHKFPKTRRAPRPRETAEHGGLCPSVKPEPTCLLPLEPQEGTARQLRALEHAAHQENHLVQKKQVQGHRCSAPLRESKIPRNGPTNEPY